MNGLDVFDEAYLYHYDRANAELEHAEESEGRAAEVHRQLAALHMARKQQIGFIERLAKGDLSRPHVRVDKEG
jgi:hypothetical protein